MGKSLASLLLLVAGCARSGAAPAESPDQPAADSSNREPAPPEDLQETHPLTDSFARGEFENVIAACRSLQADPQSGARAWCAGLAPAALYALGRDAEALMLIAGTCGHMPPATPESDARASLIALVMVGLRTTMVAPMSFAAGASTLLLAIVLDACYPPRPGS